MAYRHALGSATLVTMSANNKVAGTDFQVHSGVDWVLQPTTEKIKLLRPMQLAFPYNLDSTFVAVGEFTILGRMYENLKAYGC